MLKSLSPVAVTASLLLAAAPAGAVVPPDTRYAGGDVVDRPSGKQFTGRVGDAIVTLRTIGTARVQAGASVLNACGNAPGLVTGSNQAPIAPDGSFTVRATVPIRSGGRLRFVDRLTIRGRIDGNRARAGSSRARHGAGAGSVAGRRTSRA
jgi:hypothetical protein